jgi:hypothetical protein
MEVKHTLLYRKIKIFIENNILDQDHANLKDSRKKLKFEIEGKLKEFQIRLQ